MIEGRHVDAGHGCERAQRLRPRSPRRPRLLVGVHEGGHDDLPLADDEGIDDERERLGVERRAGAAGDDDGVLLPALRRAQPHLAERENVEHVEVIHLERHGETDERELVERQLVLEAHERRMRFLIAREALPLRQEEPLAGGVPALVQEVVDDVQPEVGHADEIGIWIDEREALPRPRRIAVISLLSRQFLLELPFQFPVQAPTPCAFSKTKPAGRGRLIPSSFSTRGARRAP